MKYTLSKKEISELTDIQLVKASPILFLTAQEQHKFLNHTTGINDAGPRGSKEFNIHCCNGGPNT